MGNFLRMLFFSKDTVVALQFVLYSCIPKSLK